MAFLRITGGPDRSDQPHKLLNAPFVVGRANSCDLPIEDKLASRKHCRVLPGGNGSDWLVEDLGSRNGTLLNEQPLQAPTRLNTGDKIRIGQVEITFDDHPQHAPTVPVTSEQLAVAAAAAGAMLDSPSSLEPAFGAPGTVFELRFSGRCGTFSRILDNPVTTVGRSEDADIDVNEPLASRVHAQFEVKATGIKVVDLESRNGTQVNGDTVNQKFLERHDRVQIGESFIEVASRLPLTTKELHQMAGPEGARPTASDADGLKPVKFDTPAPPGERPVLAYTEAGEVKRFKVLADMVTIGRSEKAGLTLDEQLSSREHISVRRLPAGSYEVEDLGSRNGTRLNGRELRGKIELVNGDVIQIGATSLKFDVPGADASPANASTAAYTPGRPGSGSGRRAGSGSGRRVGSGVHPASGMAEPGGKRRRRRRGPGGGDGGSTAVIGGVVGVIAVIAIIVVVATSGSSRSNSDDDVTSTPWTPQPRNNRAPVNVRNTPPPSNNGRPVNGTGNTPVGNGNTRPDPPPVNNGSNNTPPENMDQQWLEAASSAIERRSREAWLECRDEVEDMLEDERYGAAWQRWRGFLREWEGQPRSEAATTRAASELDKVNKLATATWQQQYAPKIMADKREERAAKWRDEFEAKFGGITSIELEATELGVK